MFSDTISISNLAIIKLFLSKIYFTVLIRGKSLLTMIAVPGRIFSEQKISYLFSLEYNERQVKFDEVILWRKN